MDLDRRESLGDEVDLSGDTVAEVDAAVRAQLRAGAATVGLTVLLVLGPVVAGSASEWFAGARLLGGMSPSFVLAAGGVYLLLFALAVRAAGTARDIEQRMLGDVGGRTSRWLEGARRDAAR